MSVTLEQVEKLRQRSGASYSDCKDALDRSGGDLLEALLFLESQGKSVTSGTGGSYSTRAGAEEDASAACRLACTAGPSGKAKPNWRQALRAAGETFLNLFRHASANRLDVWYQEKLYTSVPVAVVILVALAAFWIALILLLVGLFLGCRYRISGPDLGRDKINDLLYNISAAVDDMVAQLRRRLGSRGGKKT